MEQFKEIENISHRWSHDWFGKTTKVWIIMLRRCTPEYLFISEIYKISEREDVLNKFMGYLVWEGLIKFHYKVTES